MWVLHWGADRRASGSSPGSGLPGVCRRSRGGSAVSSPRTPLLAPRTPGARDRPNFTCWVQLTRRRLGSLLASERVLLLTHPPRYPRSSGVPSPVGSRRPSLPRMNRRLRKGCFPRAQVSGIIIGPSWAETSFLASTSTSASSASLPLPPLPLHLHLRILPLEVFILIRVTIGELVDADLLLLQLVPDLRETNAKTLRNRGCEQQTLHGQRQHQGICFANDWDDVDLLVHRSEEGHIQGPEPGLSGPKAITELEPSPRHAAARQPPSSGGRRRPPQACGSSEVLERLGAAQRFRFPSPPPAAAPGTPGSETPPDLARIPRPGAASGSGTGAQPRSSGGHRRGGAGGGREVKGRLRAGRSSRCSGGRRRRRGSPGAAPRTSDPDAARCPRRSAEGSGRAPRAAHACVTGGVLAMERAVEPWGPDLHGREEREQLRGARTGEGAAVRRRLGSENVELSHPDEFEHTPQEDDLGFKEEEDLAPGHEVGNASLKPEGIQTWDDLWVQREGPGKPQARDRGPRLLGEPRWGQANDRAAVCGECGKSFRQMSDLHQRTHRGEQPPRPVMPRRQPSRAATAAAQGPKAQDKPYICTDCGKSPPPSSSPPPPPLGTSPPLTPRSPSHSGDGPFGLPGSTQPQDTGHGLSQKGCSWTEPRPICPGEPQTTLTPGHGSIDQDGRRSTHLLRMPSPGPSGEYQQKQTGWEKRRTGVRRGQGRSKAQKPHLHVSPHQ
ncbi:hypothetical protein HPG69_005202 [Diceros bicornis minor]|uniref:C2H2-type domain-containing protein n=1 Tax=Diceros bicornis minor TaxID=77932 RepID=A0A7J7EFY2_DICBM|nr:hypothetical protein HPG69_005202 [Diceros bicornis minor]